MRTSELTGAALDWAVAKCIGGHIGVADECVCFDLNDGEGFNIFKPSTDWAQGGPIIEREEIDILMEQRDLKTWAAEIYRSPKGYIPQRGTTPLVAAMRCYVANKLGDEVEIPKELT